MYDRKFDAVQRMKSLLEKKIIRTIKIAGGAKERIEYASEIIHRDYTCLKIRNFSSQFFIPVMHSMAN